MERCPACRATFTGGDSTCRRCGCELASVMATEDQAELLLRTSVAAFADGEDQRAADLAATSTHLRQTPLATALTGFAEWRREAVIPQDINNQIVPDMEIVDDAYVPDMEIVDDAYVPDMEIVDDALPVAGTNLDTLNHEAFAFYYQHIYKTSVEQAYVPVERILENMRILVKDTDGHQRLSLAGLLAFGNAPQNFIRSVGISAVRWVGNKIGDGARDRQEIQGCVSQQIAHAEAFMLRNTRLSIQINGFQKTDLYQYPQLALREIIINAILHRDYSWPDLQILLHIFDNRIEIISPGALPAGVTLDNLRSYYSKPRNVMLAQILFNLRYSNLLGSGIPHIIHLMQQTSHRPPDFEATEQQFMVRLWAPLAD